ncbi:S41 family peptidase [Sinomicrobium sp. M5D2P17]
MKRLLLILILSATTIQGVFTQSNTELSETDKLFVTIKVWGFLKYYHPNVAGGGYNWDKQLLNVLPEIKKTGTKNEISEVLLHWIDTLGVIPKCKRCRETLENGFEKNFDLSWIHNPRYFSEDISARLDSIRYNRFQGTPYYISRKKNGAPIIQNEPEYGDMDYTDEAYRLLLLSRYWNIIAYFYPYKYLTDQSWDDVLTEMIPKFRKIPDRKSYKQVIRELLAHTDDTHTKIRFDGEVRDYLPVKIKEIDGKAVVSGFFNDSIGKTHGFEKGDIILKTDHIDLQKKIPEILPYIAASNIPIRRRNAYYSLLQGEQQSVLVTVARNKDTISIASKRYAFKDFFPENEYIPDTLKWKNISNTIGYISMAHINADEASHIMERFMDKKAIIIDLRNYPPMIYWVVSRYLNDKRRDFARVYIPDLSYPGKFRFKNNLRVGTKNKKAFAGKVIILVDDESLSRSEFTVMAFQTANNVTTIGSQTAGADGDVTSIPLADGTSTYMTGTGICYPDNTPTQRKGIKIDMEITPTIKGLREGRDEVLEAAIEFARH